MNFLSWIADFQLGRKLAKYWIQVQNIMQLLIQKKNRTNGVPCVRTGRGGMSEVREKYASRDLQKKAPEWRHLSDHVSCRYKRLAGTVLSSEEKSREVGGFLFRSHH
jgi:hypothetical protein